MNLNYIKLTAMALLAAVSFSSCEEEIDLSGADDVARVALYPAPAQMTSAAQTYTAVVTVAKGADTKSNLKWDAEITEGASYATISKTTLSSSFTETWSKKEYTSTSEGIELKVNANTEYKRNVAFKITLSDGTETVYTITQLGDKADAAVTPAVSELQIAADGGDVDLEFVSNMGDAVAFNSDADWLTFKDGTSSKVTLTATKWSDKDNNRTANFTITVGSAATSLASATVKVTQLKADLFLFMYGASAKNLAVADAIEMTKVSTGNYTASTYFLNSKDGKNPVILNIGSRTAAYPCYALASDGTIANVKSVSEMPQGPAIDVDGLRKLSINIDALTWSWERVSTTNCLPDNKVSEYKTKEYIARDGSKKTWMVEWLRWDGGDITPKLGSQMVPTATGNGTAGTGGYAADAFPSSWDDAAVIDGTYETTERGGSLDGTSEKGRIYTFSEVLTGTAQFGTGLLRREPLLDSWQEGGTNTDGMGITYTVEFVSNASFSGDNATDEADHPMLTGQWQGICPYGWHIANTSDWLDLAYAAAKASSASETFPVSESNVTYQQLTMTSGTKGIPNFAAWMKDTADWPGDTNIADGADSFGFNLYPLGWRYMAQGYQNAGMRAQTWVPLSFGTTSPGRINAIIKGTTTLGQVASVDNGNAVFPIRCVKNYVK